MPGALDRFRAWNRRRIAAHRQRRGARPTVFGFVMNGTDDMVAGQFEPEETALIRTLMSRCDRFVNVGANTGYYCLFARKANLPVTALEPVPGTAAILLENLSANKLEAGATVLPVAAGPAPGSARIFGVGTGASLLRGWADNPDSLSQIVPVVRLDDVVTPPAKSERVLILVDVEGFEYPALQGATALVHADPKPVWMIEIAPDGTGAVKSEAIQGTFDLMAAAGYTARCARSGLDTVSGPVSGVTNYIFHAAGMTDDTLLGPQAQRVAIYHP